jgi:hypothetical protein
MSKIHWKGEEVYHFLYNYAKIMLDNPDIGIAEAARQAQELSIKEGWIQVGRRREIHNASFMNAEWREKLIGMREKVLKDRILAAEAVAEEPKPIDHAHEALVTNVLALLGDTRIQHKLREVMGLPNMLNYPTTDAAKAVISPKEKTEAVKKKKRIFIVGLKGSQPDAIKRFAGARLDLHFLDAGDRRERMREQARSADVSIAMLSFVNHGVTDAVKTAAEKAGKEYKQISGTLGDLQRVIGLIPS